MWVCVYSGSCVKTKIKTENRMSMNFFFFEGGGWEWDGFNVGFSLTFLLHNVLGVDKKDIVRNKHGYMCEKGEQKTWLSSM
jgi:hypothetical protein